VTRINECTPQVENVLRIPKLEKKELDIEKESSNVEEVIIDAIEHVNLILEDREGQIILILKRIERQS
jgi:two-component system phosphate regulon sensor histidine kinase PhoR